MPRAKSAELYDAKDACENLGDDLVKGTVLEQVIYAWFALEA
jgi:hypothetical protein